MASRNQRSHLTLSCDVCRRRKSKCNRMRNGSCQRCTNAGIECTTSSAKGSRPYYQTSKEQFELMSAVVRHFLPNVSLEIENLRRVASGLGLQRQTLVTGYPPSVRGQIQPRHDLLGATEASAFLTPQEFIISSSQSQVPDLPTIPSDPQNLQAVPVHADIDTFNKTEQVVSPPQSPSSLEYTGRHIKLIADATNNLRLDNGSGWASFFWKFHSDFLSTNGSVASSPLSEYMDGRPVAVIVPRDLPPKAKVNDAAKKFFREVNSIVYVLNFEQFEDIVETVYDLKEKSSNASVAIMLAVVALAEGSDHAFNQAYYYLDHTVSEGSLESVQAIMLFSLCRLNRGERNAGWVLLGCAQRIAQSLGLHEGPVDLPQERRRVKEIKAMLWWSLYSLDTILTCSIGQPLDSRTASKRDIHWLEKDELCINPYTPPGYAAASASLSIILEDILSRLYLDASQPDSDRSAVVAEMLSRLNNWLETLPLHLKPDCRTAPTHLRAVSCLSLRYYDHIILITRPYLLKSNDRAHEFSLKCEDANIRSLAILKELNTNHLLSHINYFDGMYVLSNGMILLLRALRWPTAGILAELESYQPTLQTMQQMKIGRSASGAIASYIGNLRTLLHHQRTTISGSSEGQTGPDQGALEQALEELCNTTFASNVGIDWSIFLT